MNNQRITVGICSPVRTSGGGQVFLMNLIKALSCQDGVESVVVYQPGSDANFEVLPNVEIVDVPSLGNGVLDRLVRGRQLGKALARTGCDVLLFPGTEISPVGRQPRVFWPLTVAPQEPDTISLLAGASKMKKLRWNILRERIRFVSRHADAALFSSNYARSLYGAVYPTMSMLPSEVVWPASSLVPASPRRALGSRTGRQILFVSHLYPYKMAAEMIEGFGLAVQRGLKDAQLLIAGGSPDGAYSLRIDNAIAASGAAHLIERLGVLGQVELNELYANADLFLFPSASENAGSYALIDAFRYGLPVLSSDRSSMREICGPNAMYFDPSEPESLAGRLIEFFSDEGMRLEYARLSAERYEAFPSWDDIGAKVLAFLNGVVVR